VIDALLYSVRDGIRAAKIGYGAAECEIMDDGKPPPRFGNVFVAVHGGNSTNSSRRNLDELLGFSITLTMRVTIPLDRLGDQMIARNLALVPLAQRQGFNAKVEQLRGLLHMNWPMVVLTGQTPPSANDNIVSWATGTVYGFVEPANFAGYDGPTLVGSEWIGAAPAKSAGEEKFAVMSEIRFAGARRLQPQTAGVGPNV
jgi:hypothetical protein